MNIALILVRYKMNNIKYILNTLNYFVKNYLQNTKNIV